MAQEEDDAIDINAGTNRINHINYGTSRKPGLLGAVEDFKNHHSREYAITLAEQLTKKLAEGNQSEEFRAACQEFLFYCRVTLFYERDLDASEIADRKVNPTEALNALRAALKEAFPVQGNQASFATGVAEVTAK